MAPFREIAGSSASHPVDNITSTKIDRKPEEKAVHSDDTPDIGPLPARGDAKEKKKQKKKNKKRKKKNVPTSSMYARGLSDAPPVEPHFETRTSYHVIGGNAFYATKTKIETRSGLYATSHLKPGTRIICEPPILTKDSAVSSMAEFEQLRSIEQDLEQNMRCPKDQQLEKLSQLAKHIHKNMIASVRRIVNIPEEDRSDREKEILESSGPKIVRAWATYGTAHSFHTQRSSETVVTPAELEALRHEIEKVAIRLFILQGRLRHSCVPNCTVNYNPHRKCVTVHTTRDVRKGEELTMAYIEPAIYYCNHHERGVLLRNIYNVSCRCEACDTNHPKFTVHDKTRGTLASRIGYFESSLANVTLNRDLENPREFEDFVLSMISALRKTGCDGPELIRYHTGLVRCVYPQLPPDQRKRVGILAHSKICASLAKKCFGGDDFKYGLLELERRSVQQSVDEEGRDLEKTSIKGEEGEKRDGKTVLASFLQRLSAVAVQAGIEQLSRDEVETDMEDESPNGFEMCLEPLSASQLAADLERLSSDEVETDTEEISAYDREENMEE